MIHLFQQREVLAVRDFQQQLAAQSALRQAGIPCSVRSKGSLFPGPRLGDSFGESLGVRYCIYVHKDDHVRACEALRLIQLL